MSAGAGMSAASGSMIFLPVESKALAAELKTRMDPSYVPTNAEALVVQLITDVDGVQYKLIVSPEAPQVANISMHFPAFDQLKPCGVDEHLRKIYGPMLVAPEEGNHVALRFDASGLSEEERAKQIETISQLRRNTMACAFDRALVAVASKSATLPPETTIRFRPSEPVWILPRADRVSVVYALEFSDPTDRAIARNIAQEFVDAQRSMGTAPTINFSDREPPLELRSSKDLGRQTENFVGYLTFALHLRHIDTEAKRRNVINLLVQFRAYLDYHIKAAKSYLHTRMRSKVDSWLQVLNRARPEDPFASKEKKLASGRVFIKK